MKRDILTFGKFIFYLLALNLMPFAGKAQTESQPVSGYFANARKKATLIIKAPQMNSTETGCDGGCITIISFSDAAIPAIRVTGCVGGNLTNLGDLNGDGLDEIGLLPGWSAGCWRDYRVYTFKGGEWGLAVAPFPTHCNEFEAPGVKPIIKDPAKPGNVIITYSVLESNDIVFKTKSEPVK